MKASSARASSASWRPSTSFAYSSWSFAASVTLILQQMSQKAVSYRTCAHSSILSPSLVTLLAAESNIGLVISILRDSIQTLSYFQISDVRMGFYLRVLVLTNIVSFVEHHDRIFWDVLGHLVCHFGIQKVPERIDDHIDERDLKRIGRLDIDIVPVTKTRMLVPFA